MDINSKYEELVKRISLLESKLNESGIWNNLKEASKINGELINLKKECSDAKKLKSSLEGLEELISLSDDLEIRKEVEEELSSLEELMSSLEVATLLNGPYDNLSCFLEIHPGAGGTEAMDWASMLLRMYERFCDANNYKYEVIDYLKGEEAGIKAVTLRISGNMAYGYFKGEKGVHRLVRISPFDANKRRHTSFAAVDVMPEIDDNIGVEINDSDIRVDIYRSSGPGGQGVNTTDSAVRITHIPTGIVVTCQNERSQIRNKEKALEVLKGKLLLLEKEKQDEKINGIKGEQLSNGWGSAKRSYVLCPYTLVKDNNSGYESSNVSGILNGEIEEMLEFGIKE